MNGIYSIERYLFIINIDKRFDIKNNKKCIIKDVRIYLMIKIIIID